MIDPKKALATADGQGEASDVEGRSQLVHMATSGLPPDEIASSLAAADRRGDALRVGLAVALFALQNAVDGRALDVVCMLYLVFVFPVWTARAAWAPIRGRRPERWLSDLVFQLLAAAQGFLLGFLACWTFAGGLRYLVGRPSYLGAGAEFMLVAAIAGVGTTVLAWTTGQALVDREVERLPREAVPSEEELALARFQVTAGGLVASLARSWFRAAVGLLVVLGPMVVLDLRPTLYRGSAKLMLELWLITGGLLGLAHLGRSVLTISLARGATLALGERARRLLAAGPGEDGSSLVPESTGTLAWQRLRAPAGLVAPAALALGAAWVVRYGGAGLGTPLGAALAFGLGAGVVVSLRRATGPAAAGPPAGLARLAPRALVAGSLAVFAFAGLSVALPMLEDAMRSYPWRLRRVLSPFLMLLMVVGVERLMTLWATGVARLTRVRAGARRDGVGVTVARGLTAGVAPGILLMLAALGAGVLREPSLANQLFSLGLLATGFLGLQVGACLRLAEALDLRPSQAEGAPAELAEEVAPPAPAAS